MIQNIFTLRSNTFSCEMNINSRTDVDNIDKGYEFMLFNDTFNNISVISRRSVLLVEETGVPAENYRHAASQ